MSVRVMTEVWGLDLPDSEKIVLLALADCANDEGGCWPSMATLAKKCSKSDRTIQGAIKALCAKGHMSRDEKPGKGCFYIVHPTQTPEAASPRSRFAPKRTTQTPEAASDKPSRTIIPQKDKPSGDSARAKPAHRLPDDWQPDPLTVGTVAFEIVQSWEPGRLERALAKFRDHWAAASGAKARKHDWQAAWRTWIGNEDEFGNRNRGRAQPHERQSGWLNA